ncbi:MAG: hypothetical protein D6815_03490 [Candidatus Dadabacteria bacterium]|nr:MAG: hypothetical protein D6815_03490 [Candidatus Dadabacteria bacterium]
MRDARAGVALVLVLWTFAVLSVLAGEFARAMRQEAESTRTFKEGTIARYAAIGAINEGLLAVLTYNGRLDEELEPAATEAQAADEELGFEKNDLEPILRLLEGRGEWVRTEVAFADDEEPVTVELRATSEDGKVPLNSPQLDETVLRRIVRNLGYDEQTAAIVSDSILDWRDEDDFHRENGAEDDYYESLPRPYQAKDDRFDALEELLLVRGVTRDMFYGGDDRPGLRDIFTVYTRRPRLLETAVSEEVRQALCGLEPVAGEAAQEPSPFGADAGEEGAPQSLSECLAGTQLGVARTRTTRPSLGWATLEARVVAADGHVLAHVGMVVRFQPDGFRTVRWYDAIFDEEG